jgi:hypothetical protein
LSLTRISVRISHRVALVSACATVALAVTTAAWAGRTAGRLPAAAAEAGPAAAPRAASRLASSVGPSVAARPGSHVAPVYRTPHQIAWHMLVHRLHWKHWQFKYLDLLWTAESGWNRYATNPYSGAYGIPQAVPGSKMAAAGPRWRSSARTQIRWGMLYIRERYGTPYWAWENERWYGWY